MAMYRKTADLPHRKRDGSVTRAADRRCLLAGLGAVMAAGFVSSACTGFLPGGERAAPRLFTLAPTPPTQGPKVDRSLAVLRPFADAGLDTTRIALRHNALEIEYYAQANWQTRAPDLLRSTMVDALADSGRFRTVTREPVDRDSLVLEMDLRRFDAVYHGGGAPRARIRINVRLRRAEDRQILASQVFDRESQASRDAMVEIVAAFDAAVDHLLHDLADWIPREVQAAA